MITKNASFARYSKSLCWIVAAIWFALSVLAFTGGSASSVLNGFLWLAGAVAFAVSAVYLGKSGGSSAPGNDSHSG